MHDVVCAEKRQRDLHLACRHVQCKGGSIFGRVYIAGMEICLRREAETNNINIGNERAPVREKLVICIQNDNLGTNFAGKNLAFCMRHGFQRSESFEVRRRRVRDSNDFRLNQRRQACDFTGVVCTHFNDRVTVFLAQPCEHQRHADFIVEIALCRQRFCRERETTRNHFLERCLAVAAGYADYGCRHLPTPVRCQQAQRLQGVIDDNDRNVGVNRDRHYRSGCMVPGRRFNKCRTIKIRSLQCEKQFAIPERARIRANATELQVCALKCAAHGIRRLCQGALHHLPQPPFSRRPSKFAQAMS